MDRTITDAVCRRVAEGESLRSAAAAEGTKHPTFLLWCNSDEALADQYARAVLARADVKFEELDDVSDAAVGAETAVQVAGLRLKADNIKWQLARMSPKYSDKVDLNHTGGFEVTAIERRIVDPTK